jgi:Xaa-Pro aminopeptidase
LLANVVENVRRNKDESEVAAICAAAEIARRVFETTRRKIRKGVTENELAGILDFEIRKLGGRNGFDTIVAFGANASRPHHQPTNRKLSQKDTVLIDFGVRYNGYCCDITRCFAVGKAGPFFHRVYAAVEQAQAAALKMVRAGAEISEVDAAAKDVIRKNGLPVYGHGTGHGLGLEVHELPSVSNRTKGTLHAGDVITIEPAVYVPGKLGVRIEDDVLVTDDGYLLLSDGTNRWKKPR